MPLFPLRRPNSKHSKLPQPRCALTLERLEDRTVPATFSVLNLQDAGAGSLRQAILDANANAGADVIDFSVAGMIKLTTGALPTILETVDIDGTTAPGFAGTPVVELHCNGFNGLKFNGGSTGSALQSLAVIKAAGSGVVLQGGGNAVITGNYLGVRLDGMTVAGNGGNGLEIIASAGNTIGGTAAEDRNVISGNLLNGVCIRSSAQNQVLGNSIGVDAGGTLDRGNKKNGVVVIDGATLNVISGNVISGNDANGVLISKATLNTVSANIIGLNAAGTAALGNSLDGVRVENANDNLIGHSDPVLGVDYYDTGDVTVPVSGWQGIRGADTEGEYLICGTSQENGLLFVGSIEGVGASYFVNYPNAYKYQRLWAG